MFVRSSKFRHVYGTAHKKDSCYDDIRVTKSSADGRYCDVNSKYVAIVTDSIGGAAFLVLPLGKTGRVERDCPLVSGHSGPILDIQWSPHDEDVIASASDDTTVKIWRIPEGAQVANLAPEMDLQYHQKKVSLIMWHPSASNVLFSTGVDNQVVIWNAATGEMYGVCEVPSTILSMSLNYDGSKLVTADKDKKIRTYDARTLEQLHEADGHKGTKAMQVIYLKDDLIFSTGFSRSSDRQYRLWNQDLTKFEEDSIDRSNGILYPFYDPDTNLIFLAGKGDSFIRFYEVTEDKKVFYLSMFQAKDPQRGVCSMPKRGVNTSSNEIAKFFKLHNSGLCEVLSFTVPRKSETFQEDLYPDTAAAQAAVTGDEWMLGEKNCDPVLMSLRQSTTEVKKSEPVLRVVRKPGAGTSAASTPVKAPAASTQAPASTPVAVSKPPPQRATPAAAPPSEPKPAPVQVSAPPPAKPPHRETPAPAPAPAPAAPAGPALPAGLDVEKLLKDIEELKSVVKKQEKKINSLEERVVACEGEAEQNGEEDGEAV